MKMIFTTGEAAAVCLVSQQTIIRCFDQGLLKGFRVPGSRFRRIPRECLHRFMAENGISTDALGGARRRVLVVTDDDAKAGAAVKAFHVDPRFECKAMGFGNSGMALFHYRPDVVLVDSGSPHHEPFIKIMGSDPSIADVKFLPVPWEQDSPRECLVADVCDALEIEGPDLSHLSSSEAKPREG